ncbi:hypothetical protein BC777_3832 [Yoonia maricola]|uniref:Uncharacterized protein n=1 Tax=Yoonia maricola TaxID=420999 RepID=A0A2M8W044_9RHOB|nr:hypothetical protein [Yoonia maricola]PJI84291.1 hypothetical protein BC777_3832 [Yoonia maricola]
MVLRIWGRHNHSYDAIYVFSMKGVSVSGMKTEQCLTLINDTLRAQTDATDVCDCPQVIDVSNGNTQLVGVKVPRDKELILAETWNDIVGTEQARCHTPHHGIATMKNGQLDWFAAVCFMCDNASIIGRAATEPWRKLLSLENASEPVPDLKNIVEELHGGEFSDRAFYKKGPTDW